MACCDNPSPRILEKNNRLFCGNCKRYLDQVPPPPPPEERDPLPESPPIEEETK